MLAVLIASVIGLCRQHSRELFRAGQEILGGRQLVEDMLQRFLACLLQKLTYRAIGDNRSFVNDHDSFADSFDDIEYVRAVNDGICKRVVIIHEGSIVADGTVDQLMEQT